MDDSENDGGISAQLTAAAAELTTESVRALPWLASALVGDQLDGVTEQTMLNHAAVTALAACQQALLVCAEDPKAGDELGIVALNATTTRLAFQAVVDGANALGSRGDDGLGILVNRALPRIAQAIVDHDAERRIHGVVLAYLLALSQGTGRRGPASGVEGGILLAFPFPEPRMRAGIDLPPGLRVCHTGATKRKEVVQTEYARSRDLGGGWPLDGQLDRWRIATSPPPGWLFESVPLE